MQHKIKSAFAIAALGIAGQSFAAASGSVVFDPQNFAKNTMTAAQTAEQLQEQIASKLVLLKQYDEIYRRGKVATQQVLGAGQGIVGQAEVLRDINSLGVLKRDVSTLQGTLSDLNARQRYIANMAQQQGLTSQEYLNRVVAARATGDAFAAKTVSENARVMDSVNDAYGSVKEWEANNLTQSSDLASLQTLNQQMSSMVKLNARLLEYQASNHSTATDEAREKETKEAIKKEVERKRIDDLDALAKEKQRQILQGLK